MITVDFILENKDRWEEYKKEINKLDKDILRDLITEKTDIINIIDLDRLDKWDISWILRHYPKLIKEFKPYLDRLTGGHISWVLKHHPRLIGYFKPYLDKLGGRDISWILKYQPKLIKYIKSYLHKLNSTDIFRLLAYYPKLIKDLKPYLYRLDEDYISSISDKRPEFSLLFKYRSTEYEDAAYYYTCPSEISKLDEEEKYELSKKLAELIRKEKR